jgi:hypothetical protein
MIAIIKKWLSTVITVLLLFVLFGLIFVKLELVELTDRFFLELAIVMTLTTTVRLFWYNEGEDRAINDESIKELKSNYSALVTSTITSQEDLDKFVDDLNIKNRAAWVFVKLKGKTKDNCPKFDAIEQKLIEKSYKNVPIITSTQILTRSSNYETINATDYTKSKKIFYQTSSMLFSMFLTLILGITAYKELILNWENVFRYLTYVFSILFALVTSLWSGYTNYKTTTIDHISRLTMIVNRYGEWKQGEAVWQEQQQITQTS